MKELGRLWTHLSQSKPQAPRLSREDRQNFLIEIKKLEEDVRTRTESREEILKYTSGLKKRRK